MPISLNEPSNQVIPFESRNSNDRTRREKVEDAATATGAAGAGVAATRGNALKFFKSADKINYATGAAVRTTRAIEAPAKQSKSLINAFKVNYRNFTNQIANWARNSNMPKFMKALFTGKAGEFLGKGAAVFVFITGVGEVFHTLMKNVNDVGRKMTTMSVEPDSYDNFRYMDDREYLYRAYAQARNRY